MSFEKLRVYQAAEHLDAMCHELIARLPKGFAGEVDELKRGLGSITHNIAEAYGSDKPGRKRFHLGLGRGSADEVRDILRRMSSRGGLPRGAIERPCNVARTIAKMLTAWMDRLGDDGKAA